MPAIGGVASLDNPQVWNMLEDFTTGSKVAFLTVNPKAEHQLYLLHEEKGGFDSTGVWWSNTTYELESWYSRFGATSYATHALSSLTKEEYDAGEWLECGICDNVTDYWVAMKNNADSFCVTCGSCYMCSMYKTNCLCYQAETKPYDNRTGYDIPAWGW